MNVIDIDRIETKISQRLPQLVLQVSGSHAMNAAGEVFEAYYSGLNKGLFNIPAHVSWRRAVEWEIPTLAADNKLFAGNFGCGGQTLERSANRSLAALEAIVGRRINYIC